MSDLQFVDFKNEIMMQGLDSSRDYNIRTSAKKYLDHTVDSSVSYKGFIEWIKEKFINSIYENIKVESVEGFNQKKEIVEEFLRTRYLYQEETTLDVFGMIFNNFILGDESDVRNSLNEIFEEMYTLSHNKEVSTIVLYDMLEGFQTIIMELDTSVYINYTLTHMMGIYFKETTGKDMILVDQDLIDIGELVMKEQNAQINAKEAIYEARLKERDRAIQMLQEENRILTRELYELKNKKIKFKEPIRILYIGREGEYNRLLPIVEEAGGELVYGDPKQQDLTVTMKNKILANGIYIIVNTSYVIHRITGFIEANVSEIERYIRIPDGSITSLKSAVEYISEQ